MNLYEINESLKQLLENEEVFEREVFESALQELNLLKEDKIENVVKYIRNIEGDIAALKEEINRFAERKRTLENKQSSLKNYLKNFMEMENKKLFKVGNFEIRTRKTAASVNILDEALIEDSFKKVTFTVDKTAIKEAIKEGIEVKGAELKTGSTVIIK